MNSSLVVIPQPLPQRERLWRVMEGFKQQIKEMDDTINPLIALGARRRLPADLVVFLEELSAANRYFLRGFDIRIGFIEAVIAEEMGLEQESVEDHVYRV